MLLAMRREVVLKKLRDLAVTLAVLVVLFGMLMAINPRVREQFNEMTRTVQGPESLGPVQNAAYAAVSIGSDYAADNPFLFSFLVAAVVLFMLMLRS
jgi:ribose/xylose/arabinose/galactoside ABC-type transport system permease subunit